MTDITPFHAKYYANELVLQKSSNDDSRLSSSLFNSSLTINPHQIDAALFAFKSPLSKGVLLADEVGLGKTIEAGLVLCQLWSERKHHLLVICPAALRKQWNLELLEKFNLPSIILESKTYNEYIKLNKTNPFNQDKIVICSYQYAAKMYQDIAAVNWDTVVIDEAHKLRNSYRESNRLGQAIKLGTKNCKKILLTATPLQNSLIELYGLSTVIDDYIFGDLKSFRQDFVNENNTDELKYRLSGFCKRTLRKDVTEYINYTERFPIIKEFSASDTEQQLYDELSTFLQKDESYAIPISQKHLTTLVIRKVMASSISAVKQTLQTILDRLLKIKEGIPPGDLNMEDMLDEDAYEILEEESEELQNEEEDSSDGKDESEINRNELNSEIEELNHFIKLAESIGTETKSITLLDAIQSGSEIYRMNHPLGQYVLDKGLSENADTGKIVFDISNHNGYKLSQVEQLKGKSGYLSLSKYSVSSLENEEYLLFVGCLKDGTMLDAEQCQKLFECEGCSDESIIPENIYFKLNKETDIYADGILERVNQKNLEYVREEEEQLGKWTEDMITAIEKELDLVKKQIREAERSLRLATSTQEHLEIQETLQFLNKKKRVMRVTLEENEEEVQAKRDNLIDEIKQRAKTNTNLEKLFTIEWDVR